MRKPKTDSGNLNEIAGQLCKTGNLFNHSLVTIDSVRKSMSMHILFVFCSYTIHELRKTQNISIGLFLGHSVVTVLWTIKAKWKWTENIQQRTLSSFITIPAFPSIISYGLIRDVPQKGLILRLSSSCYNTREPPRAYLQGFYIFFFFFKIRDPGNEVDFRRPLPPGTKIGDNSRDTVNWTP